MMASHCECGAHSGRRKSQLLSEEFDEAQIDGDRFKKVKRFRHHRF